MVIGGEAYQFAHLVLRVVAADGHEHVVHARALAGLLRQFGIVLDFYAPGLVVNKMQV